MSNGPARQICNGFLKEWTMQGRSHWRLNILITFAKQINLFSSLGSLSDVLHCPLIVKRIVPADGLIHNNKPSGVASSED